MLFAFIGVVAAVVQGGMIRPLTKKYAATDKPHVRMTERVVAPEALRDLAVVTSSHNHTDHLDAETLRAIRDGLVCNQNDEGP